MYGGASVGAAGTNSRPLISYLPHCQHGSVLITSRNRGAAQELVEYADIIAIEPMNKEDALQLIQNKLGQYDDKAYLPELAAVLEYIPLAIIQAAAYILQRRPRCSVRKYLDEFCENDRRKAGLLGYEGGKLRRDTEANSSILITWWVSFDYILRTRQSAANMLSLMSFCDRQGIPEILVRDQISRTSNHDEQEPHNTAKYTTDRATHNDVADDNQSLHSDSGSMELQSNYSDNDRFENDIMMLQNFSFVKANNDGVTFEMHRLVQLATLDWLKAQKIQEQWRHRFLVKLCEELPTGEYENWATSQVLFPHVQLVAARRPEAEESVEKWATILYKAAWYALRMGRGVEAEELSKKALKAREKIFDVEHDDVVDSLAMVASAHSLRGGWSEAEELEVQVMETSKKKLGENDPYTLTIMANLASTYRNQGRWEAAEELEVQVMETRKKKLGEIHPDTLTSMSNLAITYSNQGRWGEAEDLFVQVVETRKKKLGEDHPDTLTGRANLAATYRIQGRWEAAEELEVQVMETSKMKLGEVHPDTLTSMSNLASTYSEQGRWEAAEELEVEVMEMRNKKLGKSHPDTLTSMSNLGVIFSNQSRWDAAEELEVQVMEMRKKKLGEDHHDTLTSMANFASTYSDQGRWDAAEELEVQVMETRKKKLGEDHPDTLTSMNNLARTYWSLGRLEEAKTLMRHCVPLLRAKLGASHPNYSSSAETLARWES